MEFTYQIDGFKSTAKFQEVSRGGAVVGAVIVTVHEHPDGPKVEVYDFFDVERARESFTDLYESYPTFGFTLVHPLTEVAA